MSEDGPSPGGAPQPAAPALNVDIVRHSDLWEGHNPDAGFVSDAMIELAVHAALAAAPPLQDAHYEVTVLLTDDAEIQDLNRTWRGKDNPTNVLSFPASDTPYSDTPRGAEPCAQQQALGACIPLGDIVIGFETTSSESHAKAIPFGDHVCHLIVHGLFHLLAFDHQDDAQAEQMEELERRALATMGIADPYGADDSSPRVPSSRLSEIAQ